MVYQWMDALARKLQCKCLLCTEQLHIKSSNSLSPFGLCTSCKHKLALNQPRCPHCALVLPLEAPSCGQCLKKRPTFSQAIAATSYNSTSKPLINRCKHHQMASIRCAADLIAQKLTQLPDIIMPTPMHHKTWLKRGNNHSYLLAQALSTKLGTPFDSKSLQQRHLYGEQKHLNFKARKANVKHAFSCQRSLKGLNVAIVDDILTSMATANEITSTLQQSGANHVEVWVIARTEKTV